MADPKVGTGKKPKGSGRRLYTDENPKDTVGIKFATPSDARRTVAKVKKVNKTFARKIQILTVGEHASSLFEPNVIYVQVPKIEHVDKILDKIGETDSCGRCHTYASHGRILSKIREMVQGAVISGFSSQTYSIRGWFAGRNRTSESSIKKRRWRRK